MADLVGVTIITPEGTMTGTLTDDDVLIPAPCETCGTTGPRHRIVGDIPDEDDLIAMMSDQVDCWATDDCEPVEPDGHCEHGHPSWLRALGYI